VARQNLVLRSINDEVAARCVDIFRRPDGTVGFEEFRRDVEDGRGWFPVGGDPFRIFEAEDEALAAALAEVAWLGRIVGKA
jgi:hypothetical protein